MQIGCRLISKHLNGFNYCSCRNVFCSSLFKQNFLQNKLPLRHKNISRKIFITRHFTASFQSKRKPISNIDDLKRYIGEEKQFYLKLLTNILNNIKFDNISSTDAKLLLTCCGSSVVDSSKQMRDRVCQDIYKNLLKYNKLDIDVCHAYVETCTENSTILNCKELLSGIKFEPNQTTYKLLLDNVCENGDVRQALMLLELMKAEGIHANEEVFNKLVLAHTICGGVESGETVVRTMRAAQIPETDRTRFSILKGVLQRSNVDDVDYVFKKYSLDLTEKQFLELLEIIGLNGNIHWLPKIKHFASAINVTRDFIVALKKICIHLVHMDKAESAMEIFEEFVEPDKEHNYGFFILKEMLHCDVDIERIIKLCKHLHEKNLNQYALEDLAEIALRHKYVDASCSLLENMSIRRPHFFWPLLVEANKREGETGIFNILNKMSDMGVQVDAETLQNYVLPFYNMDDVPLLVKKLQSLKITVKDIVNSLLIVLLEKGNVKTAADLYNINIAGNKLFRLISSSWIVSKDSNSVISVLQKYCESNPARDDLVGNFLIETLNKCESDDDIVQYIKLLELVHERKLKINTTAADALNRSSSVKCNNLEISGKIKDAVNMLLDFGLHAKEPVFIPHPRNMSLDELECHLIELKEKNMQTRGVLRKLIQLHANLGHFERVNELRKIYLSEGYEETIGMKCSLMHSYAKEGYLQEGLNVYNEIRITAPNFKIDDFKVIDLVTLLVKDERYDEATDVLKVEAATSQVIGGPALLRNCWRLLDSFKDPNEQVHMFKFLVEAGYCKPSNIIFGPLVRIHLSKGDLEKSVNIYLNCAKEYKCTPLQLELVKAILKVENEKLLQLVIDATESVHGKVPAQVVLIAALAENGQLKELQKLLMKNAVNIKGELQKRCERWVQEGKVDALKTLANVCERFSKEVFDVNYLYSCITRIYSVNDDNRGALEFYEQLLEKDIIIDKELEMQLKKLSSRYSDKIVRNI
ncbi:hypothetical protein NQ315_010551 [Exocentrus adspersus]|uniref:Leucine-rich PPR motif-containing protein, mitochondrial n=1 Tax=Exocentrus adspersus TaxID=1586481 RepID=A0AAV8W5N5_9CUCU|nr:hypothetical protein NQ315_010551 [Exocentrus adspersus]